VAKKAIHKIVRYSLIVLALVIVGLLIAPFFIDVNDYKSRIEHEVENATGRHLSIGEVQASLFPWVGVRLDQVRLANRDGFSERDFLSVERLHVKLALLPLLNRKIEIKQFEIDAPKFSLERHADGQTNWDDLLTPSVSDQATDAKPPASGKAQDQGKGPVPMLAALKAESLRINDGQVIWLDAGRTEEPDSKAARPLNISGINLALDDVQLDRPIPVLLTAKVSGNTVQLDAQVGPLGNLNRLNVQTLPIQGEIRADEVKLSDFADYLDSWPAQMGELAKATARLNVRLEQHPDGVRISEGEAMLAAAHEMAVSWKFDLPSSEHLELRRASLTVDGKEILSAKGNVKALTSKPHFQLRLGSTEVERQWLADIMPGLAGLYDAHPAPWKHVKFEGLLAGDSEHLDIRDLQLSLDGELVQASGAVIYQRPDIRLRVTTRELHLDPWLPRAAMGADSPADAKGLGGASGGSKNERAAAVAEPDLRFLKPWRLTAKVQADALSVHGLNMKNFQVNITGSDGLFDLNPMKFSLSGGQVEEKASLNAAVFPAHWKESVHVNGVRLGPVLKSLVDMDMLEGTLAMDTSFKAKGLTDAAMATLNGRGNVLLRDGKIRGFNIAGAIRRFTNPGTSSGTQETDFAQLSGSFTVTNGIATNKDLFMASPLLRVTGEGTVNLVLKQLDYHIKPRVVGSLSGQGDTLTLRKGLTVPLHISGPFAAPKIRPEINAKTLIENAPALLNKKGGVLGKILGGKSSGNTSGAGSEKAQPKSPQPAAPEKKIRDAIGGLLKGL